MLGSNLCIPQGLGPTQMAEILPPWRGLPPPPPNTHTVRVLQTFHLHLQPLERGVSKRWRKQQPARMECPHLLQYNMIAITGFCCKKREKKKEKRIFKSPLRHIRKEKIQLCSFEEKNTKQQQKYTAKSNVRINYHRILIINLYYKNMPQFPHLSMKGKREWQRIISYTLSILIMTRSQFIQKNNL